MEDYTLNYNSRKINKDNPNHTHYIRMYDTLNYNYKPKDDSRNKHSESISPLSNYFERITPTKYKTINQKKNLIRNNRLSFIRNQRKYNNLGEINLTNNNSLRKFGISPSIIKKSNIFGTTIKNTIENNIQKDLQLKDMTFDKSHNDEIIKLNKKIFSLENKLNNIIKNNFEQKNNNSFFNSENIQNYEIKINELKDKIISSNETINNLIKENQSIKNINNKLNKEIIRLKKNISNIKEIQNKKSNNINNIRNNNSSYLEKINNLENEISKKNEEINDFKLKVKNLNEQLSNYKIINEDMGKLKEENEQLKNKLINFQNLMFIKNEKIKEMKNNTKFNSSFNLNSNNSDINLIFNSYNNVQSENLAESDLQLMASDNEIQQQYDDFKKFINEQANKNKDLPK